MGASTAFATDMASTIYVAVIYPTTEVITSKIMLMTGPSRTKPCGYVKGPVAKIRFTIVADDWAGERYILSSDCSSGPMSGGASISIESILMLVLVDYGNFTNWPSFSGSSSCFLVDMFEFNINR